MRQHALFGLGEAVSGDLRGFFGLERVLGPGDRRERAGRVELPRLSAGCDQPAPALVGYRVLVRRCFASRLATWRVRAGPGHEQELVLVYAVAVFANFRAGLLAMARSSHRRGSTLLTATSLAGAVAVAFTLVVNLARVERPPRTKLGTVAISLSFDSCSRSCTSPDASRVWLEDDLIHRPQCDDHASSAGRDVAR